MKFLKKHLKKIIILAVIAGVITGGYFWIKSVGQKTMQALNAATVETAIAEKRDLVSVVAATGKITSVQSKDLSSSSTGLKILSVNVEVGDEVKEGDVLFTLDSTNLSETLENAKDSLSSTKKSNSITVNSAQRSYESAVTEGNVTAEKYYKQITDAEKDIEDAKNSKTFYENMYDDAKEKTEAASKAYATYTATVSAAETNLNKAYTVLEDVSANDPTRVPAAQADVADKKTKLIEAKASADPVVLANALSTAQANESNWLAQYNAADSTLKSLEKSLESIKTNQQDAARSIYQSVSAAQDQVNSAKISTSNNTDSLETQISNYEEQLEACVVKAPFAGVVTSVNISEGNTYTGSPAVTIEDCSAYEISTEIDEYDIGKIKTGQRVVIKTNGTGDEELEGTVKSIAPRATAGTSVTYKVVISVDTPNDMLKLDMTAKVSIILEESNNTLTVPYDAVKTEEDGRTYIEVVDGRDENSNLITHKVYVTTGIETDYYIEVSSDELKEGDEVKVEREATDVIDFSQFLSDDAMGGM